MRLYRLGDEGPAVGDIQDRLAALGFESEDDARSVFGDGTVRAVKTFQKAKGLDRDGIVGPDTWRVLYEAGYRLGDRILYSRRPMIRGEDVSELQSRLNTLGFDAGKVDGIFGPDTERAVIEFQHNRGLAEDGTAGPAVITELRLVARGTLRGGRQAIREQQWLRDLPRTIVGARIYFDADCRDSEEANLAWRCASAAALATQEAGALPVLSRSQDVTLPERLRARRANRSGADLIVAFQASSDDEDRVLFFSSEHSRSEAGALLAGAIADAAGGLVEGRASAMLKETRAPAAIVARRSLSEDIAASVVVGLNQFFAEAAISR